MHEWMTDNGQTPYLVIDAATAGVEALAGYTKDGRIILNVSWQATQGLKLGNEAIEFSARFGGASRHVQIPAQAVLGIYARETGQGMLFQEQGGQDTPPPGESAPGSKPGRRKPGLRVVK